MALQEKEMKEKSSLSKAIIIIDKLFLVTVLLYSVIIQQVYIFCVFSAFHKLLKL